MSSHGGRAAQAVNEYEAWLKSWSAERTSKSRVQLANRLIGLWGLDGFTQANVQEFLAGPQRGSGKKPWSKWTKATYHGHLTDLCKFLVAAEYIVENPMGDVRGVKRPGNNPNPLSESQAELVLSVASGMMRDWILLALHSGLRAHEVAKLAGEDVTVDGIRVEGKGGTNVTLPIHPELWEIAQRYPRAGYWFRGSEDGHIPANQLSGRTAAFFTELGIKGGLHRCRHLYCTRLLRRGVHIRKVQRLMRHTNLETTAAYAAVDEDELRDAINLLPTSAPQVPPPAAA